MLRVCGRSLPLRDPAKHELIQNFKNHKDCKWINGVKVSYSKSDNSASSLLSGWLTSFQVAQQENIPHESPVLQKILENMTSRSHLDWGDEGMEKAYKDCQLPGYLYEKTTLNKRTLEEKNLEEIGSASAGALGKKASLPILRCFFSNSHFDWNSSASLHRDV